MDDPRRLGSPPPAGSPARPAPAPAPATVALRQELPAFAVVGVVDTGVHFGLFNALHGPLGWEPLLANGVAMALAVTNSYLLNRHWTFRHRARTGALREYPRFAALNLAGWLLSQASVAVARYLLGLDSALALNAALAAGVVLGAGFRFTTYRRWVFPPAGPQPQRRPRRP